MRKYIIAFTVSLFLFFGTVNALTKAPVDVTTMSIDELLEELRLLREDLKSANEEISSLRKENEGYKTKIKKIDDFIKKY